MNDLQSELTRLAAMPAAALRKEWRQCFGSDPPRKLSGDLLLRAIAYRAQERALGGLSQAAKKMLRHAGADAGGARVGSMDVTSRLRPGSRLVRDWRGQAHSVTVLDDGFEYQGQRYRSLTDIARKITGAHWSGPRFFGVVKSGSQSRD